MCGVITGVKWFKFKKVPSLFSRVFVSAKKVGTGKFAISTFYEKLDNVKEVGILRQRACDGKVKNTWVFFSKRACFFTLCMHDKTFHNMKKVGKFALINRSRKVKS